jgi:hypothetical protein
MQNKRKDKQVLMVAILIESILFAGVILYYNNAVSFRDSELVTLHGIMDQQYNTMTQLDNQVNSLNDQIATIQANLQAEVAQLNGTINSANLITALGITEVISTSVYNANDPATLNHLFIKGTVSNEGLKTAYNAGLSVSGYDANNASVVNLIVPLGFGIFGIGVNSTSSTLGSLAGEQTATINISIYHEGTAVTWKIIPVWTTS